MKLKNKKNLVIILILLSLFIPFVLELLFTNIKYVFGNIDDKVVDISSNNIVYDNENITTVDKNDVESVIYQKVKVGVNQYVKRFSFHYNYSGKNADIIYMDLTYKDGTNKKHTFHLKRSPNLSVVSIKINSYVSDVNIVVKSDHITFSDFKIINKKEINIFRMCIMYSVLLIIYIAIFFYKKNIKIEYFVLILILIIGGNLIMFSPKNAKVGWDEQIHYERTLGLLQKDVIKINEGEEYLINYRINNFDTKEEIEQMDEYVNSHNNIVRKETQKNKFIKYDYFVYLPSALTIQFCKLLKMNNISVFIVGKFVNLLIFALLMSYTVKIAKKGKMLLVFLALMPTTLFIATKYSADSFIIGCLTLSTTIIVNEFLSKDKLSFRSTILYALCLILGSLPKAVYIVLIALPLFLKKDKFKDNKQYWLFKIAISFLALVILSTFVLPLLFNSSSMGDIRGSNTSYSGQISFLLHNPVLGIKIFIYNIFGDFFLKFFGKSLTFFAYSGELDSNIYFVYLGLLLFSIFVRFKEEEELKLDFKYKILMLFVGFVCIFGIHLSMYCSFTEVGAKFISGVQHRYFFPLYYLLFIPLSNNKIVTKYNQNNTILFTAALFSVVLLLSIFNLYTIF